MCNKMKMRNVFAAVLCATLSLTLTVAFTSCDDGEEVVIGGDNNGGNGGNGGGNTPNTPGREWVETFSGYEDGAQTNYAAETGFTSTATGVTWTVAYGTMSQVTDYAKFDNEKCFTMGGKSGSADDGESTITSSVLPGGVKELTFGYVANAGKSMEVQVLVGGSVVWTSGVQSLTNNASGSEPTMVTYNVTGANSNAVIKFINRSKARRISIGNLSWKSVSGEDNESGNGGEGGNGGNGGEGGDIEIGAISTLEGDVTVSGLAECVAHDFDDYFSDANDWTVEIYNADYTEAIYTDIFTSSLSDAAPKNGTYNVDLSWEAGTASIGFLDDQYYPYGTWYFTWESSADDADMVDMANVFDGKFVISGTTSNATVAFELYDIYENKISGTYQGEIQIVKGEYASVSGNSLRAAKAHARKMALRTFNMFSSVKTTFVKVK